jgi:hypothetical protein
MPHATASLENAYTVDGYIPSPSRVCDFLYQIFSMILLMTAIRTKLFFFLKRPGPPIRTEIDSQDIARFRVRTYFGHIGWRHQPDVRMTYHLFYVWIWIFF